MLIGNGCFPVSLSILQSQGSWLDLFYVGVGQELHTPVGDQASDLGEQPGLHPFRAESFTSMHDGQLAIDAG